MFMYNKFIINNMGDLSHVKMAKSSGLRSKMKVAIISGVFSAINRVLTVLQKAICEQLPYYYIAAFCMVHSRRDGKAVLCRP
jgi:hypothetical protein